MTKDEIDKLVRTLKAAFKAPAFLSSKDDIDVWFNALNMFEFKDIESGVNDYILSESRTPTIHDICERVSLARKNRLRGERVISKATNTYLCPKCKDTGFILYYKDENGNVVDKKDGIYEYMKTCGCASGATNYPKWYKEDHGKA